MTDETPKQVQNIWSKKLRPLLVQELAGKSEMSLADRMELRASVMFVVVRRDFFYRKCIEFFEASATNEIEKVRRKQR